MRYTIYMNIVRVLRHFFIPHEGNDHLPHLLRDSAVSVIAFFSIFLLGASYGSSFLLHKTVLGANIAANVLVDLANDSRVAYNEAPLARSATLDEAALLKGKDMVALGYFAHNSPAGVTPWHWFKEAGYIFLYAGENLAINFTESQDIQNAWLASPLHRANLLDVNFKEIGIATVDGIYQGNPTTYVVQMFGTPVFAGLGKVETQSTRSNTTSEVNKNIIVKNELTTNKIAVNTKPSNNKITPTEPANNPEAVKGESTETFSAMKTVLATPGLLIVKNTDYDTPNLENPIPSSLTYSTWYERLIFGARNYVDSIYKVLILIITMSLIATIFLEVRKRHTKHILYGALLLLILSIFVYINRGFL